MSSPYNARWRHRRKHQLQTEPLCAFCFARDRIVAATVADHVVPHRGDPALFEGPLQSLCKPCHDSRKQMLEQPNKVHPHASWSTGGDQKTSARDPALPLAEIHFQ